MMKSCMWVQPLGRIFLSTIFIVSGLGKAFNFGGTVTFMDSVGVPFAGIALILALILEIGGGLALLLGWRVRYAAYALIGFSVLATLFFHLDFSQQANQVAFFKNIGLAVGLMYVIMFGAGKWSIDNKNDNSSESPQNPAA